MRQTGDFLGDLLGDNLSVDSIKKYANQLNEENKVPFIHFAEENLEDELMVLSSDFLLDELVSEKISSIYHELEYPLNRGPFFYASQFEINYNHKTWVIFTQDGIIMKSPVPPSVEYVLFRWDFWEKVLYTKHAKLEAPVILLAYPTQPGVPEMSISPVLDMETNVKILDEDDENGLNAMKMGYDDLTLHKMNFAYQILSRFYTEVVDKNRNSNSNEIPFEILSLLYKKDFKIFSEEDCKTAEVCFKKGKEKFENKDYRGAIEDFSKVIEIDPNSAASHYFRAASKSNLEDYSGAEEDYTKTISTISDNPDIFWERGNVRFELNKFDYAIEDFSKVIELDPKNDKAFYKRGLAKKELEDYNGALEDFSKAIEINPEDDVFFRERGNTKIELKDYNGALEDFNKAIELKPNKWSNYSRRGYLNIKLKNHQSVIEDYTKVIELGRKSAVSYFSRGSAKSELKDYPGAIEDFNKAIELDPEWIHVYQLRGMAKSNLKDYQGTIEDFNKAIELNPDWWGFYSNRGDAKKNLKDYQGAIEDYNKVIELNSKHKWTYQNRGNSKIELNDYQGAIEDFSKVIEIDPDYKWAYQNRGKAKSNLEDYQGAIEDFNKVIEIDPDYKWAYEPRGIAKSKLKDYQGAIEDFNNAIEKGAKWGSIYYNRGLAKHDLKDYKGALEDYNYCVSQDLLRDIYLWYNIELAKSKLQNYRDEIENLNVDARDSNYINAYFNRAKNVWKPLGLREKEIEDLNKVIEIDSNNKMAYQNRGEAKYNLRDFKGAIEDFSKVIEIDPKYQDAYYFRGKANNELEDYKRAIEDFDKIIEINPDSWEYYSIRGKSKRYLKDYQGAIEDFTKVIENNSENRDSYYGNRGQLKIYQEDYRGAIEDFNRAIEINPNYTFAYYNRGKANYKIGNLPAALKDYNNAIENDKMPWPIWYKERSIIKKVLGDYKGSKQDIALFEAVDARTLESFEDILRKDFAKLKEQNSINNSDWIKESLIANTSFWDKSWKNFTKNEDPLVRSAVALNRFIPNDQLIQLLKDNEKQVRLSARKNTSCTDEMIENAPKEKKLSILIYGEGSEFMQGMIPTEKYIEVLDIKNKTETDNTSAWFEYLENNNEDYWDYNDISHLYGINLDNLHIEIWEDDISIFKSDSYWDINEDIRDLEFSNEDISEEKGRSIHPSVLKAQNQVDDYKGVLVTYKSYEVGFEFRVELDVFNNFDNSKFGFITASTDYMGLGTDFGDFCLGFKYDDVSYYAEFESKVKSQEIYFNGIEKPLDLLVNEKREDPDRPKGISRQPNDEEEKMISNLSKAIEIDPENKVVHEGIDKARKLMELGDNIKNSDTPEKETIAKQQGTLQDQIAKEWLKLYPNAEVKKINASAHLDIHMPNIYPKRGTHIWFNTPKKGGIKVGFYCRDKEFIEKTAKNYINKLDAKSNGIRLIDHPTFNNVSEAIKAGHDFAKMLGA